MINLKNKTLFTNLIVLFILISVNQSCKSKKYRITKIEGEQIGITSQISETPEIENFIKPYRNHINKDLDSILSYCPVTLDKSKGEWQTNIGNFMADACFLEGNKVFQLKEKKTLDICILNHGGIRSIIPKGKVTTRTAFEVMPFENSMIVVALKGSIINEMVEYLTKEKKPHPLSGIKIYLNSNLSIKSILIKDKAIETNKIYYVVTSDYLSNGGDNMSFFAKNEGTFDLDYKIRNVLIDYFRENDTIYASDEKRIIID